MIKQETKTFGVSIIRGLRELGYTPEISIADIIDNSIAHKAKNIEVKLWEGGSKHTNYVSISDDGEGMNENEIVNKAMEWGKDESEITDDVRDFSKYGLGLKLASIAHCTRLTVISKGSEGKINLRTMDLDEIEKQKKLFITNEPTDDLKDHINELETKTSGTTIVWHNLEKMYESEIIDKKYAHRAIIQIRDKIKKHIEMTFGNFLHEINIFMPLGSRYKSKCLPWDPFIEKYSQKKPTEPIKDENNTIKTTFYILPKRTDFEQEHEFDQAAGSTGKWIDRQGIYIYRKGRLILPGGWHGLAYQGRKMESKDNYLNRIRVKIDYDGKNDSKWKLKVSKSEAIIPAPIRKRLEQLVTKIIDEVKNSEKKVSKVKDKSGYETPWIMTETKNIKKFTISRNHELIKKVRSDNNNKENFDLMLKEIEKSIPNYIEQDKKIIATEKDKIIQPKIISEFINLIKDNNKESAKEKLKLRYPNYHEFVESLGN